MAEIKGRLQGEGIDPDEPEYMETEITVPVKIRAQRIISFMMEAASFKIDGEVHHVNSGAGVGGSDIAILKWGGKTYVIRIEDFVDAIIRAKPLPSPPEAEVQILHDRYEHCKEDYPSREEER